MVMARDGKSCRCWQCDVRFQKEVSSSSALVWLMNSDICTRTAWVQNNPKEAIFSKMLSKSHLGKLEEEEGKDEEEKEKPWKQESSSPGSQPVTRQTGNMRCKIGNFAFLNGPLSESLSPVAHC